MTFNPLKMKETTLEHEGAAYCFSYRITGDTKYADGDCT